MSNRCQTYVASYLLCSGNLWFLFLRESWDNLWDNWLQVLGQLWNRLRTVLTQFDTVWGTVLKQFWHNVGTSFWLPDTCSGQKHVLTHGIVDLLTESKGHKGDRGRGNRLDTKENVSLSCKYFVLRKLFTVRLPVFPLAVA